MNLTEFTASLGLDRELLDAKTISMKELKNRKIKFSKDLPLTLNLLMNAIV